MKALQLCVLAALAAGLSLACSPATQTDSLLIGGQQISQELKNLYVEQFSSCMLLFPGSSNDTFRTGRPEKFSCMSCYWGDCLLASKLPPDEGNCRYYRGPDCRAYKGLATDMAQPCN